jgi:hypothetical protein
MKKSFEIVVSYTIEYFLLFSIGRFPRIFSIEKQINEKEDLTREDAVDKHTHREREREIEHEIRMLNGFVYLLIFFRCFFLRFTFTDGYSCFVICLDSCCTNRRFNRFTSC